MVRGRWGAVAALALCWGAVASPVSLWRAEGDTLDSAGPNDGVAMGGVGYRAGGEGQGFDVSGGAHVVVSDPVAGGLVPVNGFTVAAWFVEDTFGNNASIVNARPPGNSAGFTVESAFGTPNSILFAVHIVTTGFQLLVVPGFTIGERWHIAATFDAATGDLMVYRDGDLVSMLDGEPAAMSSAGITELLIGRNIVTHSGFDGMIDEVQIFDRALRADEIKDLLAPCPEDINGDGDVDFADLNLLLGNFNMSGEGLAGDIDGDDDVDFADLNRLLGLFNTAC